MVPWARIAKGFLALSRHQEYTLEHLQQTNLGLWGVVYFSTYILPKALAEFGRWGPIRRQPGPHAWKEHHVDSSSHPENVQEHLFGHTSPGTSVEFWRACSQAWCWRLSCIDLNCSFQYSWTSEQAPIPLETETRRVYIQEYLSQQVPWHCSY